jgi:Reeler domain
MKIFIALVCLGIPLMVQGYSSGAPAEECSSMTPRHHVDPQKGPSPYDIILDKKAIRAGESVLITIKGRKSDDVIKGLLVQARVGDTPIGSFDVSPSREYIQILNCGSGRGVS